MPSRPEIVRSILDEHLDTGADVIETDVFDAQAISQADHHTDHLASEIELGRAHLAKAATAEWARRPPKQPRFVAGLTEPTSHISRSRPMSTIHRSA